MHSIEIVSVGLGLVAGGLAGWLFPFLSTRIKEEDFWPRLQEVIKLLVSGDEEQDFFGQYIRLLPLFAKHLAKTLLVALLAISPVILAILVLSPQANQTWNERATHIELSPTQALAISWSDQTVELGNGKNQIPVTNDMDSPATLVTEAGEFRTPTLLQKQAYTPSMLSRGLLSLIGFQMLQPESDDALATDSMFILQPTTGGPNLLLPSLNDWGFDVLAAQSLPSLG